MEDMTAADARSQGLRRLSDLTTWLGVGAVAVTGVFAGLAAHAAHTTTTTGSVNSSTTRSNAGSGLASAQPPGASALPSHVRSGSS